MEWVVLIVAGMFEIGGAIALKFSSGFRRLIPTLLVFILFGISFYLLSGAATQLAIGTAYAIWTGIGAAGTAVIGMATFGEFASPPRVGSLALIVLGAVGMRLFS